MSVGRYVRLTGRVQGVFFRAWTQQQAQRLGVAGWIRNCPDGSVEAKLAGEEEAVGQLIDRMREGPPGAEVDHVEVEDVATEVFDRFEVRH
jgi:acylphosphatase